MTTKRSVAGEGPSVNRWSWTGSEGLGGRHFLKIPSNQLTNRFESLVGLITPGGHLDDRAMPRRQHHQAENAFAIDFVVVLFHADFTGKGVRDFDELGSRSGMNSKLIGDGEFFLGH